MCSAVILIAPITVAAKSILVVGTADLSSILVCTLLHVILDALES
jgi:hypothetical protein